MMMTQNCLLVEVVSMKFDLHFYAPSLQNFRKHFVPISELQLIPFTLVIGRTLFHRTLNELEYRGGIESNRMISN